MADDDSWLYGEENEEETPAPAPADLVGGQEEEAALVTGNINLLILKVEGQQDFFPEMSKVSTDATEDNDQENSGGSDDDSDDDGIKVTIDKDKIEAAKTSYQNMHLKQKSLDFGAVPSHKEKKGKFAVEDFDNIGTVNGQTAVEVDLDSLEEKPWRKPGADITGKYSLMIG